MAPVELKQHL